MDDEGYHNFLKAKQTLWDLHGYGPWGFVVDGQFVGWGGLQYEEGDADLALALHPDHWGLGKALYQKIIHIAFTEMEFQSITALLPPSRARTKGMAKLGFKLDGKLCIDGECFIRHRLSIGDWRSK